MHGLHTSLKNQKLPKHINFTIKYTITQTLSPKSAKLDKRQLISSSQKNSRSFRNFAFLVVNLPCSCTNLSAPCHITRYSTRCDNKGVTVF